MKCSFCGKDFTGPIYEGGCYDCMMGAAVDESGRLVESEMKARPLLERALRAEAALEESRRQVTEFAAKTIAIDAEHFRIRADAIAVDKENAKIRAELTAERRARALIDEENEKIRRACVRAQSERDAAKNDAVFALARAEKAESLRDELGALGRVVEARVGAIAAADVALAVQQIAKRLDTSTKTYEHVDHPPHYRHASGVEAIDVVENLSFCVGNALKYLWRAGSKPGQSREQDIDKALWYLRREFAQGRQRCVVRFAPCHLPPDAVEKIQAGDDVLAEIFDVIAYDMQESGIRPRHIERMIEIVEKLKESK